MKVAILGDIGQRVYHVGDEAMTHAAVDELRDRGVQDLLLLTRDIDDTLGRYEGVSAAPTLEFPWAPNDRKDYLRRITDVLGGRHEELPPTDQVWAFIESIRSCDALFLAGGGNLNSLYGWLLYERAAAVAIAKHLGKPVVVGGQTFGPTLYGADRVVATSLIEFATLTGARETFSLGLGKILSSSAEVLPCLDDASVFASKSVENGALTSESVPRLPERYIAATFAHPPSIGQNILPYDEFVQSVAELLRHAKSTTGLPVVFLPHMSTPGSHDGDVAVHSDIAVALGGDEDILMPIQNAHQTAALTANASLVLTTRYHPVIFAMDGEVPVLAISVNNYSDARLRGALGLWGLDDFVLAFPSLAQGIAEEALVEAWSRRDEIRGHCKRERPQKLHQFVSWWDVVVSGLNGKPVTHTSWAEAQKLAARGQWSAWHSTGTQYMALSAEVEELTVTCEHLAEEAEEARHQADDARNELRGWLTSRSFRVIRAVASVRALLKR